MGWGLGREAIFRDSDEFYMQMSKVRGKGGEVERRQGVQSKGKERMLTPGTHAPLESV